MTTVTTPTVAPPSRTWPPEQSEWTYEDWLRLPDDNFRYEVINGELFMAPPPAIQHQTTSGALFAMMWLHAKQNDLGTVLEAPVGVKLPNQPVPVQPDIVFIRKERHAIIGKENVEGAPDLIVEILSPSNWTFDRKQKFQAYREAGVNEYWIVDYRKKTVEVFLLESGSYTLLGQYGVGESVTSTSLATFTITVDSLFAS